MSVLTLVMRLAIVDLTATFHPLGKNSIVGMLPREGVITPLEKE